MISANGSWLKTNQHRARVSRSAGAGFFTTVARRDETPPAKSEGKGARNEAPALALCGAGGRHSPPRNGGEKEKPPSPIPHRGRGAAERGGRGREERGNEQPRGGDKASHGASASELRGEVVAAPVALAALDAERQGEHGTRHVRRHTHHGDNAQHHDNAHRRHGAHGNRSECGDKASPGRSSGRGRRRAGAGKPAKRAQGMRERPLSCGLSPQSEGRYPAPRSVKQGRYPAPLRSPEPRYPARRRVAARRGVPFLTWRDGSDGAACHSWRVKVPRKVLAILGVVSKCRGRCLPFLALRRCDGAACHSWRSDDAAQRGGFAGVTRQRSGCHSWQ
jgi:hypothetical protein